MSVLRVVGDGEAARGAEALAHLLACLDEAARLMRQCGQDVDCQVIEAHAAQLRRGREWPGDRIEPTVFSDGSTSASDAGGR